MVNDARAELLRNRLSDDDFCVGCGSDEIFLYVTDGAAAEPKCFLCAATPLYEQRGILPAPVEFLLEAA